MLIFAEGTVNEPLSDVERAAVRAWLGPMVDEGFIQSGYSTWLVIGYGSWFLQQRYIDRGHCLYRSSGTKRSESHCACGAFGPPAKSPVWDHVGTLTFPLARRFGVIGSGDHRGGHFPCFGSC
jgi:hypothetical protein